MGTDRGARDFRLRGSIPLYVAIASTRDQFHTRVADTLKFYTCKSMGVYVYRSLVEKYFLDLTLFFFPSPLASDGRHSYFFFLWICGDVKCHLKMLLKISPTKYGDRERIVYDKRYCSARNGYLPPLYFTGSKIEEDCHADSAGTFCSCSNASGSLLMVAAAIAFFFLPPPAPPPPPRNFGGKKMPPRSMAPRIG
jgi:hypothetical protein